MFLITSFNFSSYKSYNFIKIIHTWIYILLYWECKIFQIYIQCTTKCSQLSIGYLLLSLYFSQALLFPWNTEFFLLLNLCKHRKWWTCPFISFAWESDDHSKTFFLTLLVISFACQASPPKILLFSACSSFTLWQRMLFPFSLEMLRFPRLEYSSYPSILSC